MYSGRDKITIEINYDLELRRHVSTSDDPGLPRAARYTAGNRKISGILSLDFTSMVRSVRCGR